jgi:hypothetical protein
MTRVEAELLSEIKALRTEVASLREQQAATVRLLARVYNWCTPPQQNPDLTEELLRLVESKRGEP